MRCNVITDEQRREFDTDFSADEWEKSNQVCPKCYTKMLTACIGTTHADDYRQLWKCPNCGEQVDE